MFDVLIIFGFLLVLKLEEAGASPITVMGVARSRFAVPRTTVEKIKDPFAVGGGGLLHVFKLTTTALTRVKVGLKGPPSKFLLTTGLRSQMLAQILVYVRVILPLHGQCDHEINQIIVGVCPRLPLGRLPAVILSLGGKFSVSQRGAQ